MIRQARAAFRSKHARSRARLAQQVQEFCQLSHREQRRCAHSFFGDVLRPEVERLIDDHVELKERHERLQKDYYKVATELNRFAKTVELYKATLKNIKENGLAVIDGNFFSDFDPWGIPAINKDAVDYVLLAQYLNTLLVLRRITHPAAQFSALSEIAQHAEEAAELLSYGPGSMKTEFAEIAIELASRLFSSLVGWAVDHRIGVELLPPVGEEARNIDQPTLNGHKFELRGAEARDEKLGLSDARRAAEFLTGILLRAYPSIIAQSLHTSMVQVNLGAQAPLFRPARRRRAKDRDPAIAWILRAHAVGNVFARVSTGALKQDAIAAVAAAYGVTIGAVRNWERRLPEAFGSSAVDTLAYNAQPDRASFSDAELQRHGELYRKFNANGSLTNDEVEAFFPSYYQVDTPFIRS
jgi:hypothetical protein